MMRASLKVREANREIVNDFDGTAKGGKKSNCDIQKNIESKIKVINELSTPIQCDNK